MSSISVKKRGEFIRKGVIILGRRFLTTLRFVRNDMHEWWILHFPKNIIFATKTFNITKLWERVVSSIL